MRPETVHFCGAAAAGLGAHLSSKARSLPHHLSCTDLTPTPTHPRIPPPHPADPALDSFLRTSGEQEKPAQLDSPPKFGVSPWLRLSPIGSGCSGNWNLISCSFPWLCNSTFCSEMSSSTQTHRTLGSKYKNPSMFKQTREFRANHI